MNRLEPAQNKVVGYKQVMRALACGKAECVFVAKDAHSVMQAQIVTVCCEKQIEPVFVESMRRLGESFGIHVGAATAATIKAQQTAKGF